MKAGVLGVKLDPESKWRGIIEEIKRMLELANCKVDMSYFATSTDEDAADLEKAFRRNRKLLTTNDFVVVETTKYSGGIGYLIAEAIHLKKPVLALYNEELGDKPSNVIMSSQKTKQLVFYEYTQDTLEEGIDQFVKKVKRMIDTKFIVQLPPELDQYIEWVAFEENTSKSQVVREAISNKMKRNERWKEYLKETLEL